MPEETASAAKAAFARLLISTRKWYGHSTGRPHLDQEEFAADLSIQGERYRRYERGETEPPIWLLGDIRRLTGVSLDFLIANTPPGHRFNPEDFPPDPPKKRKAARKKARVK